jgi:hypothetical protein
MGTACFIFWIGEENVPVPIHSGIISCVSPVLDRMTQNGMKESSEQAAFLEAIDIDTFKHFAAWSYSGMYQLPPRVALTAFCSGCRTRFDRDVDAFPFCTESCKRADECDDEVERLRYCVDCGLCYPKPKGFLSCNACKSRPLKVGRNTTPNDAASEHAEKFALIKCPVRNMKTQKYRKCLKSCRPGIIPTNMVTGHALLYIFADTYMIDLLKQQSLHLLHRDFMELEINETIVDEIARLVGYTYETTSARTTNDAGSGADLRDVVLAFVMWRYDTLVTYEAFKDLLGEGGDFSVDMSVALAERLVKQTSENEQLREEALDREMAARRQPEPRPRPQPRVWGRGRGRGHGWGWGRGRR